MINVLISVNQAYLPHVQVMLRSLRSRTDEDVEIYLLNHTLDADTCAGLSDWAKSCGMVLHVIDVFKTQLDGLPIWPGRFSVEMYYRIIAQYVLPAQLDRVMWLDADIVVLGDLAGFYHQKLDGYCLAACPDRGWDTDYVAGIKNKVGLPKDHQYFNSGVLLLNLEQLRQERTLPQLIAEINTVKDRLTYPDQDILNHLYDGKTKYCSWREFNYQLDFDNRVAYPVLEHIRILHFTGYRKPWEYQYFNGLSHWYWDQAKLNGRQKESEEFYAKGRAYWPVARMRDVLQTVKGQLKKIMQK